MTDHGAVLSEDDARILALESVVLTGHTLKLLVLEPGPPLNLDAFRERVNARLDTVPHALEQVSVGVAGAQPRWICAEDFRIANHVRRRSVDCETTDDLRRELGVLMAEHLDHARPLWSLDLIGPLADGREVIAARIHHAMADGIAAMHFLEAAVVDARPASDEPVATTDAAPTAKTTGEWRRVPATISREWGHRGSRSPFDLPLTGERDLAFATVALSELKAIGASRPIHATVNDVLLAAVAGGLRGWLRSAGTPLDLRAQVPVSLHHRDGGVAIGNHDSFLNVDLELSEPDPLLRLDRISAQTRTAKQTGDATTMYELFHALGAVPVLGKLLDRAAASSREFSLAISNVPGPRSVTSVSGRRVSALYSASEPGAHHALRIAAISHGGTIGVGFCTDPLAVPGIENLAIAVEEAFEELRRL
ncbi:wax ester/triacylglycerol synthase domain-containing protein [Microbacterium sp. R86528]|uniref:wax ester/triacylglycerol synthase domain-containing protein n=1 Tax=Microbacterium sp. R86528 TaxID=3093864 RepID=UPI0037C812FA